MSASIGRIALVCVVGALVTACSAGRIFQRGNQAAMQGDWDMAVSYYTAALQARPDHVEYRMALDRAHISAAQIHFDKARELERRDQLDAALMEYRKVVEYHPGNQEARAKVTAIEQTIRDRVEASRPRPAIEAMRDKARKASAEVQLNPKSREPIDFSSRGQLRDILVGMGGAAGITVNFDRDFQEKTYSVDLKNISFEQALQQVTAANQLFYKVLGESSILIIPDTPQKRPLYEEWAVQTFYLSHADPTELLTLINTVVRLQTTQQPVLSASKSANTILVRATVPMMQIIDRIIRANDKPRAEIVIDVEILEVNRNRAKQFGVELSQYAVGMTFSPESAPGGTTSGTAATNGSFNLTTVSKGVSTNDFYASVPSAVVNFLESDIATKVIAKPQLRGTEGEQLSLNLGEELPVPSTTFTPIVSGGTAYTPMTSFQYKPVGVNVEMKPRVTYDGDVIIELKLEVSAQGPDKNIAGQNLPSFTSRKVGTKLRLRDGEPNLLAGLLREDERTSLKGLPGTLHIPILSQLFASNDKSVAQTDIVMLLTPHIVRTQELTQQDFMPIYIGTQQNVGLTGPPPTIGQAAEPETAPPAVAPAAPQAGSLVPGTVVPGPPGSPITAVIPPGSSPIPGTVGIPAQPVAAAPAPPVQPPAPAPMQPPQPAGAAGQLQAPPAAAQPAMPAGQGVSNPSDVKAPGRTLVVVGAPTTPLMVAGGPYTVPIAISGETKLNTISVSVLFNPRVLRVRLPQEGDFMRQGGAKVTFTQKVDETAGRIDMTLTRANDTIGVSGEGVLAGIIFDAIGAGTSTLTVAGVATAPGGASIPLQFIPATVTVR